MRLLALLIAACADTPWRPTEVACDTAAWEAVGVPAATICDDPCTAPQQRTMPYYGGQRCVVRFSDGRTEKIDCGMSSFDHQGHAGCCVPLGPAYGPNVAFADCGPAI